MVGLVANRRIFLQSLFVALCFATGGGAFQAGPAHPVDSIHSSAPAAGAVADRIIVAYETDALDALQERVADASVAYVDERAGFFVLDVDPARQDALLAQWALEPGVRYVQPDGIFQASFTPDDPLYGSQWGPGAIGMEAAWDNSRGSHAISVAVLDTGVDYDHPDLVDNYCQSGSDWSTGDGDPKDTAGHGTHVAGTIAAAIDNGVGVAGMADACLIGIQVLSSGGWGYWSWSASGIHEAVALGADIISMSLGGGYPGAAVEDAVKAADAAGVLIIAAAGNGGCSPVIYPAAFPEVVAVASLAPPGDVRSGFSNCGFEVELAAPGSSIVSTVPGGGYASYSGTSMATPHASGVAALIMTNALIDGPDYVRCVLRNTADDLGAPGWDMEYGYGRIDATEAWDAAALAPACMGPYLRGMLPGINDVPDLPGPLP